MNNIKKDPDTTNEKYRINNSNKDEILKQKDSFEKTIYNIKNFNNTEVYKQRIEKLNQEINNEIEKLKISDMNWQDKIKELKTKIYVIEKELYDFDKELNKIKNIEEDKFSDINKQICIKGLNKLKKNFEDCCLIYKNIEKFVKEKEIEIEREKKKKEEEKKEYEQEIIREKNKTYKESFDLIAERIQEIEFKKKNVFGEVLNPKRNMADVAINIMEKIIEIRKSLNEKEIEIKKGLDYCKTDSGVDFSYATYSTLEAKSRQEKYGELAGILREDLIKINEIDKECLDYVSNNHIVYKIIQDLRTKINLLKLETDYETNIQKEKEFDRKKNKLLIITMIISSIIAVIITIIKEY